MIAWLTTLVFFTSTTGISIYEHICNTTGLKEISLLELLCLDDIPEKDILCCEEEIVESDDCCDLNTSFSKYSPSGKTESGESFDLTPSPTDLLFVEMLFKSIYAEYSSIEDVQDKAPNPHIYQPKSTSERLSEIQSYLC